MKRKLFFITLLMLFCSTVFGQKPNWTAPNSGAYEGNMTLSAYFEVYGTEQYSADIEFAAFCGDELRGVGSKPVLVTIDGVNHYLSAVTIHGNANDIISFKIWDPNLEKILSTSYTKKFKKNDIANPSAIDFYEVHWNFERNMETMPESMTIVNTTSIDEQLLERRNFEVAAFYGEELRGVGRQTKDGRMYFTIFGSGEETENLTFKLYDHSTEELLALTDYSIPFELGSTLGDYDNPVNINFSTKPYVAQVNDKKFTSLEAALKAATENCTLEILTDITITSDWDCRSTGAQLNVPVTINGNDKTIKFTGKIYDANWNALFRFEKGATLMNLTLDASEATEIQRAITSALSVNIDNCTFIGNGTSATYAVIVGEGAGAENIGNVTANITNSIFRNWKNGVTDNMNGQDMKEFAIIGCTFYNTDVVISAKEKVTFTGNVMNGNSYVNITSYSVPNEVVVVATDNEDLAANTDTKYNQINAKLENITAQEGFLTPVAEINGKNYFDLQTAIDAATEGQTVKLIADVNYSLDPSTFTPKHGDDDAALFVAADDKLTIDLNGNTISVVATLPEGKEIAHSGAIINYGDLTIDDSSDEKDGKVTFEYVGVYDDGNKRHGVVMNLGTLTVNAGTLENVTELENQQAIDNTNYNKTEVSVVINGGTIKSAGYYAIDMVGYYDFAPALKNSVVINDGTIDGGIYARTQVNTNLSLNILGGEIKSDFAEAVRYRVYNTGNTHSISITGGEFSTDAEVQVVRVQLPEGENLAGFISAGTFSQDVNEFCAPGFACTQNAQGTYSVTFADYIKLPTDVTVENYEEKFGTNTVTDGTNYYPTMKAALDGIHSKDINVLYCKPGADLGTMTHGHVCSNLTVYGNDAFVSGGEYDFEVDTYDRSNNSYDCDGITSEMTLTINYLHKVAVWGQRRSENTINITLNNCKDINRVYISGTSGDNNISLNYCTATAENAASCILYSNANGTINVNNCSFTNVKEAVNLNHKVAGEQIVNITNTTFDGVGHSDVDYAAPVRVLSSVEGAQSNVNVTDCSFANTVANSLGQNADILLDYGVGLTTATVSNTAAKVMVEREDNVAETTNVAADETKSFNNKPYVAKVGEQSYTTIAEALAATTDGATVTIIASTNETIGVPAGNNVTITAADGVKLSGGVGGSYYNKSVTFDGLTFNGGKGMALTASVDGLTYTVKNCTFDGVQATAWKQGVISLNGNATVVIENNTITNVQNATEGDDRIESQGQQSTGIYTSGSVGLTISGNTISGVDGTGISANNNAGTVTITDNTISDWGTGATAKNEGRAIRTSGGTEVAITENVMIDKGTAKEEFVKATGITKSLNASANYWNGNNPLTEGIFDTDLAGDPAIILGSYYTDAEKEGLVELAPSVAKIGEEYYQSLQDAIDACKVGGNTITFIANINEIVTVLQKEGINITIDGKKDDNGNYTFSGTIIIHGNARHTGEETLTIQNIDFYTENLTHNFIYADETGGEKGYAHNVTVKDCNFATTEANAANPSNAVVALRIRQGYDITVEGGNVNGLHSLMQLSGCNGVIVEGVTLNALSGINLQNVYNVEVKDNTFVVVDHAIRVGAKEGDILPNVGPVNVEGNNLTSTGSEDAVIVVRYTCSNIDLEITNNSIVGETHISVPQETFAGSISADANYWGENKTAPTVTGTSVDVYSYYKDAKRTQLVVVAMTFEEFVNKVIEGNGTYNGLTSENKNIKVVLEPTSGDASEQGVANTVPNRLQKYSNPEVYYAQYQRFSTLTDVNVSNVDFVFIPKAVTVKDAWNTSGATTTAENINGELQLINNGSVTFTNCSFDMMSISPINATALNVIDCVFKGLDAYAIKDVKANNVTITQTKFDECNGGFWLNAAPQAITVTNNTFTKVGRRGAIQFSAAGDYTNTVMTITENIVDGAFLWQLNNTVTYEQISAILDTEKNTYTTAYVEGSLGFVAQIGENYYFTIQAAITAAGTAATNVNVIANTTENVTIQEGANITLEFAENVTLVGTILAPNADLTINGGIIRNTDSSKSGIQVNAGKLTLNNVEITSARHALRLEGTNGDVVATINGGTYKLHEVTSQTQHVLNAGGDGSQVTVTILGGTFVGPRGTSSDSGAAVNAQTNAIVTIEGGDFSGGKNNTLSKKEAATITVKGGTYDQDPSAYLAEGYVAPKNADGKYEAFLAVAKIGETYYKTIQDAVNAAQNGETIIILADVEATVKPTADTTNNPDNCLVYVANDKTITIDLNGNDIVVNGDDESQYDVLAIRNNGNLTITDSAETAGTITLNFSGENESGTSQIHSTILNFGTLTVDKVNIVNNATTGHTSHAIFNYSWGGNAILTVKGGTITSVNKGYSVRASAYDDFSKYRCEVNIIGGTLTDGFYYENVGYHIADGAKVTISGGVIQQNVDGDAYRIDGNGTTDVAITGGIFSEPVMEEHCAEGYIPVNNGDGTYGVKEGKFFVQLGEVKYETLAEAYNAATEDNNTIVLLDNITLTETFTIEKAITLNLNEKEVTGADGAIVFNVSAATKIENGIIKGNKSGTSSGLIDIYANLELNGVTIETSKIYALRFKAGECTAVLENCNVTGAFKGYGGSVWEIKSGTYKAASTSINDQLNGTARIYGGTFYYEIAEEECAPGYVVKNNGDGIWGVEYAPAAFVDANNNGTLDEDEAVYGNLDQIFANHKEGDVYVVLTANIVANAQVDTDADAHYYFTTNVAEGVTMNFLYEDDWNYIQKMTLGQNITLNAKYLLAWTEFNVSGTINTTYLYTLGAQTTITETGVVNVNTGDATVQVKDNAILTVKGQLNTAILNVWVNGAQLIVDGENAVVNANWVDIWDGTPSVTVKNGAKLITSEDKGIKASRGGSITVADATLTGKIELGHNGESTGELIVTGNSTLSEIKLTVVGSTVTGPETLTVTSGVQGYGVNYYNGVYSLVVIETQITYLYQGWNWFSSYIDINGAEGLAKLQDALDGNATLMKSHTAFGAYSEGSWYNNGGTGLNAASVTEMYMIDMKNDFELHLEGNLVNPEEHPIHLAQNWNWIGYPLNEAADLATAFGTTPQHGDQIKSHVGFSQYYGEGTNDFGITGWWGTLNTMTPGLGYMYYRNGEATSFTYSVSAEGAKSELRANITAENNYWVPTSYQYANNMTMIAMMEGLNDGDYEIAAFINGEVRGSARPVYVEPIDAYMFFLTIHGDEVEEMTFRCYDLATGEEYAISDRINYSVNAMLGSIEEPYILRGTVGISENTAAEINIYPNPTTTGREINLETICETVEVYNALGVKIAEYHNVDTIDALETAGIYVIRVTIDGNARNYRLVVK